METHARMIYLPDTMTNWPWPRSINPHFEAVKLEVDASFRDFKALSPKSQEAFDKCDSGTIYTTVCPSVLKMVDKNSVFVARLAALAFPNAPRGSYFILGITCTTHRGRVHRY